VVPLPELVALAQPETIKAIATTDTSQARFFI
jgi:hypothetical protein